MMVYILTVIRMSAWARARRQVAQIFASRGLGIRTIRTGG